VERHEDKHPERILGEYIAADSPGEWLAEEIGDYLFGEADEESREDGLEQVFQRVDEERRSFVATQLDPHALTQFVLEVERPGRTLRASFSTIPSPLVLLDACIRIAEVGDRVIVEHSYASGDKVNFAGAWPFGMDWAVRATAPLGESLIDGTAEEYLGVSADEGEEDDEWEEILQIRVPRPWSIVGAASAAVAALAAVGFFWRRSTGH
jgi:hypothetical protein